MAFKWKTWVSTKAERVISGAHPLFFKEIAWQAARFAMRCGRSNPVSFAVRPLVTAKGFKSATGVVLVILALTTAVFEPWPSFADNTGGVPNVTVASAGEVRLITQEAVKIPLENYYVSQGFWWLHSGIDLASKIGEPVRPAMNGVVKNVDRNWFGYGNLIVIRHGSEYESWYAHLSRIDVEVGQTVTTETVVGAVGSTGRSTGPHLHLEIHENGTAINPAPILGL